MRRWLRVIPAFALIGLVSLVVACGGDSDQSLTPKATASSQLAPTLGDAPATAASIVAERVERFSLMFISVVTGAAMVLKELPKQTGIR